MTNSKDRIVKLLTDIGISFKQGGFSNAEIDGYCAGINLISTRIDKLIKNIFINLDDSDDMSYYSEFVKPETDKNRIIKRLGEAYGYYGEQNLFDSLIGLGPYYIIFDEDGIVFDEIGEAYLPKLGSVVTSEFPAPISIKYAGTGKSFDDWDNWSKNWIQLDKMGLPFSIIDTLRGSENE